MRNTVYITKKKTTLFLMLHFYFCIQSAATSHQKPITFIQKLITKRSALPNFFPRKKNHSSFSLTQYRQIFKKRNFKKIIFFTLHCLKE